MRPGLRRRLERLETRARAGPRIIVVADQAAAERARRAAVPGERLLVVITGVPRGGDRGGGPLIPDREGSGWSATRCALAASPAMQPGSAEN